MPTDNPRVNVTLSPSLHTVVTKLAQLQRVSKASVLRELLETVEPMLVQTVALMEAAQQAQSETRTRLAKDLDTGIKEAEKAAAVALQRAANITRDLVAEAEAIKGRRPARSPASRSAAAAGGSRAPKDPPTSKRGVKR